MAEIFTNNLNVENTYMSENVDGGRPVEKTVNVKSLLNVREEPSLGAKVVRQVKRGSKLTVIDDLGEWSQIGDEEFVMSQYLV